MLISGVMPGHSPLMRQNCKSSPWQNVDEEEGDDPPGWEKMKVGICF